MTALLEVAGLAKHFPLPGGFGRPPRVLRAVDGVSFALRAGETLGVVGESGCGKTTLARLAMRLLAPSAGSIRFAGAEIGGLDERAMRPFRSRMQIVFQDPYSSLNPRMRVRDIVGEPLRNMGWPRERVEARVREVMGIVGLSPSYASRYPHAFSGGQRQRIGIARALAPHPELIVADEAVSALDVSIQAQILNLLREIQAGFGLAMLFISHNLAVVRHVSDRILVMYLGEVVESATEADLFARPLHPYTLALISAVPEPDPGAAGSEIILEGDLPSPVSPPAGCRFHTRCPIARERCRDEKPELLDHGGHWARCHFPGEFRGR